MALTQFRYAQEAGDVTLAFAAEHAIMTWPRHNPIQLMLIAESGHSYVYQRSSNQELVLTIEFLDVPERAQTVPFVTDGYNELHVFLRDVVNWSAQAFVVTDPDGDETQVRYLEGFETFREGAGRTPRAHFWTGALLFRKIL